MTADERVSSIVAYLERVAAQQDGYAARAAGDMVYAGRLRMRGFMARALARRIANGEDLKSGEPT